MFGYSNSFYYLCTQKTNNNNLKVKYIMETIQVELFCILVVLAFISIRLK